MSEIDNIIDGFQRLSDAGYLRDLVFYANDAARKRCGSCYFWMMSKQCPSEKNVGGMSRGPSMDAFPCSKFKITETSISIAAKKRAEANDFAKRKGFGLPFPEGRVS
ncbi:hypothetical protein G9X67_34710 [Rhizobium sp. WYCCWR 11152]|uniref:hypothetical protein n=1 Tax=Rhizobium sp. WYCCWR 11152 TaxID=2692316 RepID=UPI00149233E9|nr:hypothetical protein [Rhizobium sp. WYCCWR 11152]NNU70405.1 hypothetical protein [Rhizobium sp. WYCCWR 11152]